jgi:hypothetical protein
MECWDDKIKHKHGRGNIAICENIYDDSTSHSVKDIPALQVDLGSKIGLQFRIYDPRNADLDSRLCVVDVAHFAFA